MATTQDRHEAIYDVSQPVAAANQLSAALRAQARAMAAVTTAAQAYSNAAGLARTNAAALNTVIGSTGSSTVLLTTSLNSAVNALNNAASAMTAMTTKASAAAAALKTTGTTGAKAGSAVLISWQSVARIFTARALLTGLQTVINAMEEGVKTASDLSIKVAEIQTISQKAGTNVPTKQYKEWSQALIKVSNEFNLPLLDVVEAQYEAISNQVKGAADSTNFIVTASKFAKVAVASEADSVNLLSSVLNAFQIDTNETDKVAAGLFKTIELGRVRASEMADQMGRVSTISKQAGVSLEELEAAIATMTVQGVKFQTSQTLISNILLKLVNPSEEMKTIFAEWGVASGDAALKTFGLAGVLERLNKLSLEGNSALADLVDQFTNIRSVTGAAILGNNADLYKENLAKIQDAQATFDSAFKISMEADGQVATSALNSIKNTFTELGSEVVSVFAKFNKSFGPFIGVLAEIEKRYVKFAYFNASVTDTIFGQINSSNIIDATTKQLNDLNTVYDFAAERQSRDLQAILSAGKKAYLSNLADLASEQYKIAKADELALGLVSEGFDRANKEAETGLKAEIRLLKDLKSDLTQVDTFLNSITKRYNKLADSSESAFSKSYSFYTSFVQNAEKTLENKVLERLNSVQKFSLTYRRLFPESRSAIQLINGGDLKTAEKVLSNFSKDFEEAYSNAADIWNNAPQLATILGIPNSNQLLTQYKNFALQAARLMEQGLRKANQDFYDNTVDTVSGVARQALGPDSELSQAFEKAKENLQTLGFGNTNVFADLDKQYQNANEDLGALQDRLEQLMSVNTRNFDSEQLKTWGDQVRQVLGDIKDYNKDQISELDNIKEREQNLLDTRKDAAKLIEDTQEKFKALNKDKDLSKTDLAVKVQSILAQFEQDFGDTLRLTGQDLGDSLAQAISNAMDSTFNQVQAIGKQIGLDTSNKKIIEEQLKSKDITTEQREGLQQANNLTDANLKLQILRDKFLSGQLSTEEAVSALAKDRVESLKKQSELMGQQRDAQEKILQFEQLLNKSNNEKKDLEQRKTNLVANATVVSKALDRKSGLGFSQDAKDAKVMKELIDQYIAILSSPASNSDDILNAADKLAQATSKLTNSLRPESIQQVDNSLTSLTNSLLSLKGSVDPKTGQAIDTATNSFSDLLGLFLKTPNLQDKLKIAEGLKANLEQQSALTNSIPNFNKKELTDAISSLNTFITDAQTSLEDTINGPLNQALAAITNDFNSGSSLAQLQKKADETTSSLDTLKRGLETQFGDSIENISSKLLGPEGQFTLSLQNATSVINTFGSALAGLLTAKQQPIQQRASGGFIRGKPVLRGLGTDTIPAALTPGEYVVRASAVRKYGVDFMDMLNRGLFRFAKGGFVIDKNYQYSLSQKKRPMPTADISNFAQPMKFYFADLFYKLQSYYSAILPLMDYSNFYKNIGNKRDTYLSLSNMLDGMTALGSQIRDAENILTSISPGSSGFNTSSTFGLGANITNIKNKDGLNEFLSSLYGTIFTDYSYLNETFSKFYPNPLQYDYPDFVREFGDIYSELNFIIGKIIQSYNNLNFTKKASGGYIKGKPVLSGMGTDTIPAALTPGEYVVKASSVRKYGVDFMNMINSGMFRFANGGQVPSVSKISPRVRNRFMSSNTVNNTNSITLTSSGSETVDAKRLIRAINREQSKGAVVVKGAPKQSAMRLAY